MPPKPEVTTVDLAPPALSTLNFYQFKAGTARFFHARLGRTTVQISDTPHFAFAQALASGNPEAITKAETFYRAYLSASWGNAETDASIARRVAQFRDSFAHYQANGFSEAPALTMLPTSDQPYVVDGNHRVSIAAALGKPLAAELWPLDQAFLKFNRVKEFYGTDNKNMPYQSVYLKGDEVIAGRRNDLHHRLAMIPKHVIAGQDILDVACNVGMSSLIARSLGAKACLGLEYSAPMVDIATRFAMFDSAYPTVSYRQYDVDAEDLDADRQFDTAFMFSIHDHLKNPHKLIEIADRNVRKHVVFEAHPGGKASKYDAFLNSGLFADVTELGRLDASRSRQDQSRRLWLCTRKGA